MKKTSGGFGGGVGHDEAIWGRELGRGSRRASIAIGTAIVVAIVSIVGASFGLSLDAGRSQFYQVKAHFPTVNGLIEGSDVFFGGVKVGTVNSLVVDPDSRGATITVSVDKAYAPVHEGATAAVRPKSLLGEKYLAMTVGDPAKPAICDGCQLPDSATSVNVELDQLINILDEPTRKELQKLIDNLGTGLAGQGPNTNQTLQTGQTNLNDLAQVTDVLKTRDAELKRIIEALTKLTQTLATDQQRTNYVSLLSNSDKVLKTLKDEDAQIQLQIDRADEFFGILDRGLSPQTGNIQGVFRDLPTTVTNLDALSVSLGRQGDVGYPVLKATTPMIGPVIFGSQPNKSTYTNDVYTRVEPAQGCFQVNAQKPDANGLMQNNPQVVRGAPAATDPSPLCTTPAFNTCTTGLADPKCVLGLAQALCTLFHDQLPGCPVALGAAQANHAPQVSQPGAPTTPQVNKPQAVVDPGALDGLLKYLLKR